MNKICVKYFIHGGFFMINAYYNGEFLNFSDVRIPLTDRGVFFGDGIYDAAIGKAGRIYLEGEHLDRFYCNAKKINIPFNMKRSSLAKLLHRLIKLSGYEEYFIYFQLTRYSKERCHAFDDTSLSNLLITIKKYSLPDFEKPLKLITENDIRYGMCDVKTLNLLPAVLASKKAINMGCDEAIFIRDGEITECAHSNISIIKNGTLLTHPRGPHILPGITRKRVLYMCEKLSIPYREISFSRKELIDADAVLVTSTTKFCLSADIIDGEKVGKAGDITSKRLISAMKNDFFDSSKKEC